MNSSWFVNELRETGTLVLHFLADQSGSSARTMGVVSVMAAGTIGLGVVALNFGTEDGYSAPTSSIEASERLVALMEGGPDPLDVAIDLPPATPELVVPATVAMDLALRSLDEPLDETEDQVADEVASDEAPAPLIVLRTDELPLTNEMASEVPTLALAMNLLPETASEPATEAELEAELEQITQSSELPALLQAAFLPVMDEEFRGNLMNGTVDAFNRVLPTLEQAVVAIQSGDTMMDLLTDFGIDRTEAYYAIEAFGEVFNPRRIRAGQEFNVAYEASPPVEQGSAEEERRLLNLSMRTAADREVTVSWDEETEDFVGIARDIELETRFTRGTGTIDSSLYMAANGMGVPDAMTINMIRIFSHSIDFQRDIRTGDAFDIYYAQHHDETGEAVMNGDVIFASMTTRGRTRNLYRFTTEDDGDTDYYDEAGQSVRAFLMRTPIDGARITSNFGPRRHPVLGYNRQHKGVDFGAPTGTPIYAAGNGTVVRASRFGSYGNYVRIRHANGYETAYAHMNGYGPGIRSGSRVEQGQIIGYVGATGRVTGAHLHYEVLVNDEQVNPRTIDLPSGRQLEDDMLTAFQEHRIEIDTAMAAARNLGEQETASLR